MSDPLKRLPSLENPRWLTDLIVAFKDRPDLHVKFAFQYAAQVENERIAKLAELSAATASTRERIAARGLDHRGSRAWAAWAIRPFEGPEGSDNYSLGNNKCNLFVYEMLTQAGVKVPLIEYDAIGFDRLRPYLAREWANPKFDIAGFTVLTVPPDVPQPGDVAAIARVSWDATGHVGIVANSPEGTPNWTVSGRADGVVHNDWGFRDENKDKVVFRRFVGSPK